jgi:hypothetical protein
MYFSTCEYCGCNLDPGERCDCQKERAIRERELRKWITEDEDGQYRLKLEEETA